MFDNAKSLLVKESREKKKPLIATKRFIKGDSEDIVERYGKKRAELREAAATNQSISK